MSGSDAAAGFLSLGAPLPLVPALPFQASTLGPNKITKLKTSPLTVGIKKSSQVKSDALVKAPNAINTKTIVVHGIDTVLQAC